MIRFSPVLVILILATAAANVVASPFQDATPPKYVPAKAYHVLPETHNNESGYFSLNEGLDGSIYIGTTFYGENAYLVEFDPKRESQRIVLDTNQLCGTSATGYAAQAKLHTRNDVGQSGRVYVGSKQGYRLDESDTSEYPGGYVMYYDPRTGSGKCLGMPMPGQGVIDVKADEDRGLTYIVTCEDQHWMLGSTEETSYRELGPILTPYATTLIASDGCGYAITEDFQLARHDPDTNSTEVRPILVDGTRWSRANELSIPTWFLSRDRQRAYLILLNDTNLLEIDLVSRGPNVPVVSRGKMLLGNNPDSRCGMALGADDNVYAVIRIDNDTGFGDGYLHHLVRFLPSTNAMEDLGVIKVENPDFFDWDAKGPDGNPKPWTHGFHRLPDGTLTPLHAHMALITTADNTIYVIVIYPFTLLKLDQFRIDDPVSPAESQFDHCISIIEHTEAAIDQYTQVAETIANRHIAGGAIGFPFIQQSLAQDLWGRSGGLVHIGFDRVWTQDRTEQQQANDVALVAYDGPASAGDFAELTKLKDRGVYLVGFGDRSHESVGPIADLCDVWFESKASGNASTASLHQLALANAVHGWTLIAEVVGALTRKGKMPTMWKSYSYDDGRPWGEKYFLKKQFHDDLQVAPIEPGVLGKRYLRQIRYPIERLKMQAAQFSRAAQTIHSEIQAGNKIYIAWQGHMPPTYIGKSASDPWAVAAELHPFLETQVESFDSGVPDGAQVIALGYHGHDPIERELWQRKNLRVIHFSGDHPDPQWRQYRWMPQHIDLGYAFGDACVSVDDYPIRLFAPSGIAQLIAYQAILAELTELQ